MKYADMAFRILWTVILVLTLGDIIEYGSTPYVGMAQEKNGGPI